MVDLSVDEMWACITLLDKYVPLALPVCNTDPPWLTNAVLKKIRLMTTCTQNMQGVEVMLQKWYRRKSNLMRKI